MVVDLLSENNWTTPSNEIAFNSSNAEDGKISIIYIRISTNNYCRRI